MSRSVIREASARALFVGACRLCDSLVHIKERLVAPPIFWLKIIAGKLRDLCDDPPTLRGVHDLKAATVIFHHAHRNR